jgi:hypothetical protein
MSWFALAGAALGAAGSIIGGSQAADAASEAAAVNAEYLNKALEFQKEQFDYAKSINQPFLDLGTAAAGQYANMLGFRRTTPTQAPTAAQGQAQATSPRANALSPAATGGAPTGQPMSDIERARIYANGGSIDASGQVGGIAPFVQRSASAGGPDRELYLDGLPTPFGHFTLAPQQGQGGQAPENALAPQQGAYEYDPALDRSRMPAFEPGAEFTNALTVSDADLRSDPSYGFRRDEALDAIGATQRARGMSLSGNALRDLGEYASGLASTEFGNIYNRKAADRSFRYGTALDSYNSTIARDADQWNRLAAATGIGQTAVSQAGQAGSNFANTSANLLAATGESNANSILAQGALKQQQFGGLSQIGGYAAGGGFNNLLGGFGGSNLFNGSGGATAPTGWF